MGGPTSFSIFRFFELSFYKFCLSILTSYFDDSFLKLLILLFDSFFSLLVTSYSLFGAYLDLNRLGTLRSLELEVSWSGVPPILALSFQSSCMFNWRWASIDIFIAPPATVLCFNSSSYRRGLMHWTFPSSSIVYLRSTVYMFKFVKNAWMFFSFCEASIGMKGLQVIGSLFKPKLS